MKKERVLNLRDITKTYLEANRWSIADMAYLIGMPRSTLSEWISGKRDLTERNMRHVKAFLNGDYIKDVSAVINCRTINYTCQEVICKTLGVEY